MKKSMIAAAVVATAAMAGAANASFFTITGGGGSTGGTVNFSFSGQLDAGDNTSTGVNASSLFGGTGEQLLNTTDAGTIASTLSSSVAGTASAGSLTWFGFHSGTGTTGGSLGYFGVMFIGNGSSFTLTVNNSVPPAAAVYESQNAVSFGSLATNGTFSVNLGATTSGTVYMWIFAGIPVGSTIGGNALAADGAMDVRYLESTTGGTTWTVAGSGTAASAGLNAATYSIPVPAPALLAGAGLVGAAALRRRMAKKA